MQRTWNVILPVCLLAGLTGGCGGYYTLTACDYVGAIGGEAPVVVRLQRNDFFVLNLPVNEALVRFQVGEGPLRAAYTDKLGYAGTTVSLPSQPGRYRLTVDHGDSEGQEIGTEAGIFAWDPQREVIAVDADCLPRADAAAADAVRTALNRLAAQASIVYMTRKPLGAHRGMHWQLEASGYPDGAILLWQRERWRIVREGRFSVPRVIVETRLVSQLAELRETFPKLSAGVGTSRIAADAFAEAGLKAVVVGPRAARIPNVTPRNSWEDLAEQGI